MRMLTQNFMTALQIAIKQQTLEETKLKLPSDSSFLAGLREVLEAVHRGERIEIQDR